MPRPLLFITALVLPLPGFLSAAPPQVRRAEAAVPRQSSASLAPAGTLGARERDILKNLDRMSTGQIGELMEAYARMGNRRMTTALSEALLKRNPADLRPQELALSILGGAEDLPDDPLAKTAEEYTARRQPAEAARTYRQLKAARYRGKPFPWQEDYAYACYEAGEIPAAMAAFEEILATPGYPEATRTEAQKALRQLLLDKLMKAGDAALSRRESTHALKLADQLLAANPDDPDAIALKAGAYAAAGQPRRAIDYLLSLKPAKGGRFPHRMALAGVYQDARMFDDARAAYQALLADPATPDPERAEATLRLKELEREARLTAGDHALRTGRIAQAEAILADLEARDPGSPEVTGFRAAVQMKRREYGTARDTLTKLRDRSAVKGEFFDGRDTLAEALAATGAPREAQSEYAGVADDSRFDTLTRYEAARRNMELQSRFRPGAAQQLDLVRETEGIRAAAENEISTGEMAGTPNVFLLRTAWDTVDLDESRLVSMRESERYQVEAVWRRNMRQGFYGEISAGGSDRAAVYGAAVGRYAQPGATSWELGFRGNDRALDSLPLVALDGRQNQISLTVRRDVTDRLSLDAMVSYRWIGVQGHSLGEGVNVNLNASWSLVTETPTRPELTLSYLAELQSFARNNFGQDFGDRMVRRAFQGPGSGELLAANLIQERLNRHGVLLTLSKKFTPHFSGYVYGGWAREFVAGPNEGLVGGGVEAFVGPRTSLFMNFDYSTSSRTGGGRGDITWSANTGARVAF